MLPLFIIVDTKNEFLRLDFFLQKTVRLGRPGCIARLIEKDGTLSDERLAIIVEYQKGRYSFIVEGRHMHCTFGTRW